MPSLAGLKLSWDRTYHSWVDPYQYECHVVACVSYDGVDRSACLESTCLLDMIVQSWSVCLLEFSKALKDYQFGGRYGSWGQHNFFGLLLAPPDCQAQIS